MRKAISNDETTGTVLEQPEPVTALDYLLTLAVNPADLDMDLTTRAVVILVPAFPQSMRKWLNREKKRIARLAQEDLERDIQATIDYAKVLQQELDRRTLAAKQARLDRAARDIARTDRRIEYNTLKRRLNGKGFRQKP